MKFCTFDKTLLTGIDLLIKSIYHRGYLIISLFIVSNYELQPKPDLFHIILKPEKFKLLFCQIFVSNFPAITLLPIYKV